MSETVTCGVMDSGDTLLVVAIMHELGLGELTLTRAKVEGIGDNWRLHTTLSDDESEQVYRLEKPHAEN